MTTQMTSGGEMAGVELVCRLMAATPPYLYNPNGPPHCFFFSDLLRSLVAKRCATSPSADETPSHSKRIRIASTGSAFSAKSESRDEGRTRAEHRSTNPLSPSCFLPRLDLLYRKLHEIEKETPSSGLDGEANNQRLERQVVVPIDGLTDRLPQDRPALILGDRQTDDVGPFRTTSRQILKETDARTDDSSVFSSVKHEADAQKTT